MWVMQRKYFLEVDREFGIDIEKYEMKVMDQSPHSAEFSSFFSPKRQRGVGNEEC